jgi:alkanesulfonate monooxygenase SsuD/methylene tetrahydromethanopterin reductase-like flavin-dependent oxidoreductase (luciferase family)
MLDNLSGGRLVAGLLRGTPNEFLTYGTNVEETREMYEEGIELILKAWTEPQPFGWQGRHYQFRTVSIWPRPLQQPHPPVFVSGNSKASATFAAHKHLNMGLAFIPLPLAAQCASFYREEAAKVGWTPTPDNMMYRGFIHVAETDEKAMEEVAATYHQSNSAAITSPEKPGLVERAGGSVATPTQMSTGKALSNEHFASMKINFCGSPRSVLEQIRHVQDKTGVGIIEFVFQGLALPHEMTLRSMELFGKEVLPQVHEL